MFNEFSITGVTHSLADKNIVLETNFKIDPESVNMTTVKLKNSDAGVLEDYDLHVENKNIIITFTKPPIPNIKYHVSVTNIRDVLDRTLKYHLNQTIIFKADDVKHKITIIKPFNGEAVENNTIEVKVKATPEDEPAKGYCYEIASDVAFCDPKTLISDKDTVNFTEIPTGQCVVRCRIQDINNASIFGEWSDIVSFIALNNGCNKTEI